jgi:hypothetical protein
MQVSKPFTIVQENIGLYGSLIIDGSIYDQLRLIEGAMMKNGS